MDLSSIISVVNSLPVNVYLIMAIVGLVEYFKSLDKEAKLKNFYPLFPFILSVIAGIATGYSSVWLAIINVLVYWGLSVLFYEGILKLVQKVIGFISNWSPTAKKD